MKTLKHVLLLAFLFSCDSESDHIVPPVIVGDTHESYTIITPDPLKEVTLGHQDSLDLNSDGIFEIKFMNAPILTVTGIGSETTFSTKNHLQILMSQLAYRDVDTLSMNSVLNDDSNWSDVNTNEDYVSYKFVLLSYACYSYVHCLGSGNFKNVVGKYIGYKLGENFGWIWVDNTTDVLRIRAYTQLK